MRSRKLALAMLVAGSLPTAAAAEEPPRKWHPWFEIGGYAGNERSRGEAVLWAPLMQSDRALLFTDIRGKLFDEDQSEGNFALGYREMLSGGWNLGAWTGYDVRRTELGSTFGQVSLGVEALHPWFDVRANAYLPTEASKIASDTPIAFAEIVGSDIFLVSGQHLITRELAFRGIDGEVGVKVPLDSLAIDTQQHELRLYAGAFAFDNDLYDGTIAGPKARIEWRVYDVIPQWYGSRLTLEAEYAWDEVRDDQVEAGVRLRLPFGAERNVVRLNAQELRMTEGLERDTDIVAKGQTSIEGKKKTEQVEDAVTQAHYTQVVTVENGNDIETTVTGAGANSLIIVKGGTGYTLSGDVTMSGGQALVGGGATIFVKGLETGLVVPFTAPGTRPSIVGCGCEIIYMNSATRVTGLDIDGAVLMVPTSTQRVAITGVNSINAFNAIEIENDTQAVTIEDVSISLSLAGIVAGTHNSDLVLRNVTISDTVFAGIQFDRDNHATLDNVRLDSAGYIGLFLIRDNQVAMSNSLFTGSFIDTAIYFDHANNTLSGSGNVNAVSGNFCDGDTSHQNGSFGFVGGASCP